MSCLPCSVYSRDGVPDVHSEASEWCLPMRYQLVDACLFDPVRSAASGTGGFFVEMHGDACHPSFTRTSYMALRRLVHSALTQI